MTPLPSVAERFACCLDVEVPEDFWSAGDSVGAPPLDGGVQPQSFFNNLSTVERSHIGRVLLLSVLL